MREKEQVVADFAKLNKGEMLIGVVQEVKQGGSYGPAVVIRGAMIGRKRGKWTANEEMNIGENTSLSRSRLCEEVGNLVVIGCAGEIATGKGKPARLYKVLLPETLAEVQALTGPEPIPSEILSLWGQHRPGTMTDSAEGDDALPF